MKHQWFVGLAALIPWLNGCGSGTNAPAPAEQTSPPPPKLEAPKVRVDKFEGHADRAPGGLKIRLETDLPDDTVVQYRRA